MSSPAINLFFALFSFLIFSVSSSLPQSQTKNPATVQTLNVPAAEIKMVNPKLPPRSLSLTSSKRYEGSSDLVHLRYHMGPVLSSAPINIYVIWYGRWSRPHKALIRDFLNSISDAKAPSPSVAEWWRTASLYTDQTGANVSRSVLIAGEYSDAKYSHGQHLTRLSIQEVIASAARSASFPVDHKNGMYLVLTSHDVTMQDFCRAVCGFHYFTFPSMVGYTMPYAWVGQSGKQCPEVCAYPFALPGYMGHGGPGELRPPNGETGRECDIDKLFQSIPVRPSTRLLSSSFHNIATSASAGPSRTTSPSNRIAMKKPGTPQSPRVFGLSDSVSLKQALRDRCISKASEMAAQKRLSKSAAASPRVSEADRIKSLYIQVSNESSRRSKGKASLVEMPLMPEQDKPSSSRSVPPRFEEPFNPISELSQAGTSLGLQRLGTQMQEIKPLHKPNKSCLSSDSGDSEIELDENVTSLDDDVKEVDKHVTSLPSYSSKIDNATELEEKTLSSALEYAASSVTEKSKTVRKVTRMIPRPKQQPKKKILVKKKIKIGIVSVTNTTKKDEETESSLDSSSKKLICQRCHSSLKSTSIDNPPPSYTTSHDPQLCSDSLSSISNHVGKEAHQVADENFSGSCNVSESSEAEIVVTKPAVTSSNNSGNSARDEKEAENNPTSSEKFEFSLSSKDSLGDYSRSTSMSEGSNISRFSCGNKPHMSMDVRWEAIKHVKLQYGSLGLQRFNLLKKLGCGDIGTVYLAELIGTNCLFAIKVMDNEFLARRKKSPRAQAERDILKMLDHPFLPTLYAQFTSDNLSCLVMEYCPGGDLHVLRQKQLGRCFPEPAARFYVAEILLALEYLHMLGVIYRDLKPENILVREDGHIMLTDFDLSLRCAVNPTLLRSTSPPGNDPARVSGPYHTSSCIQPFCITEPSCQVSCFSPRLSSNQQQGGKPQRADHLSRIQQRLKRSLPQLVAEPTEARSNSFVGTHEYLAPEIIRGEGHGAAVDWWTFGVLLYELLYGKTPFKGHNNDETLANVVLQNLKFPDSPLVSFQAKDLIRGLLVKEPENRFGSEKGSAEIKRHPFFEGLNWALIRCAIPPELPDLYEFGGGPGSPGGNDDRYLECKAIGDHLEFELF